MVMRNRHDGANAPQWWDDLPPEIKKRCANAPHLRNQFDSETDCEPASDWFDKPSPSTARVRRDLSWLALIIVAIAFAHLIFVFVALWFLNGRLNLGG
jgi:hypothetical protein